MSIIGANTFSGFPNITGTSDAEFDNITVDNISVAEKLSFEAADATDEGNMTTYIWQDPSTNDIVVNNNNPLGSFRLQYGNTPDTNVLSFEIDSYNQKLNFPVGVNPEYNISFEELYALKGVNINQSIQQQINSINQISEGIGYWGTFFSSIDQFSASANSETLVTLNGSDPNNNGVILFDLSGSNYRSIKVLNGAVYNIQICFQTSSTSSSSGLFRAWFKINGVDIPNSAAGSSHHTNDGYFITTFNVILALLPNDVLSLYWVSNTGGTHLEALPAQTTPFVCPSSPSVYLSLQQVTYYQRAESQNIYGMFQSNTTMTDASPNYVAVKWQSGFNLITLPDATITPLGKQYTFFLVNPIPSNTSIVINTYSISQYYYYFGFSTFTAIELTSRVQSLVFTCISNSTNPYWSLNQVENDPNIFFNLTESNIVPYATTFTQTGATTPAIQVNAGSILSLLGNLLVNGSNITPTELQYLNGASSNLQNQINNRVTLNTAQTISGIKTLTANIIANSKTITPVELGYINGLTGNAQTQITNAQTQVNSLLQKTTAMTYQASPERTTFSNGLVCATLDANNYIFVGGVNIYDIYTPRGLCYTKTESDDRYLNISIGDTIQDTINGILATLAGIAATLMSVMNDLYNLTTRVTDTETDITNLINSVNTLTASLNTLQTQVNNIGTSVTGLQNVTQNLTAVASTSTFSGNLVVMGGSTSVGALNINGDDFNNLLQNQW